MGKREGDDQGDEGKLPVQGRAVPELEVGGQAPAGEDEDQQRAERPVAEAPRHRPQPLPVPLPAQQRHHREPEDQLPADEERHREQVQVEDEAPAVGHGGDDIHRGAPRDAVRKDQGVSEFRIVVLASGNGTNLQAILDRLHGREGLVVVGVGSDKREARALGRARAAGVETAVFPREEFGGRGARDAAMGEWVAGLAPDLVALAGYMQILSAEFVGRFRDRLVNVHPSLLPAFPGLDAVGQALAAGAEATGVTVHFVDEGVDTGPVILQRQVPVPPNGDREELENALHAVEHELYPEAIRMLARGEARIDADDLPKVADR
ncbi:MAG: phosphoribosylglycinamide formyltransferase [Actinobacteria bacterium]|nr:phosphoribosylglycinamide formyltransferase [Actinomycetota bacterium]